MVPTELKTMQKGFITLIIFIPFIMILVIQEAYRNIRFWYDVDHFFLLHVLLLLLAFIDFM